MHDNEAINELYDNAYVLNCIQFDHNEDFLNNISMEAKYSYGVLTSVEIDNSKPIIEIDNLNKLPTDYNSLIDLTRPVKFKNNIYSYSICILNLMAGFKDIKIIDFKSNLTKLIFEDSRSNLEHHSRMSNTMRFLNYIISVHPDEILTLPLYEAVDIAGNQNKLIQKLPVNPCIGNYIYNSEVEKAYLSIPKHYKLAKLAKAKFSKVQFSRVLMSIGYVADDKNIIQSRPIKTALLNGLSEDEYFDTSIGARKGLVKFIG